VPVGAVKVKVHPVNVGVDAVNPVGALGRVVVARPVDSADVPPAFVAVILILLYGVFGTRPVIVAVVPDTVDTRVVALLLTV